MTKEDIEYWSHVVYLCSGVDALYGKDYTGKIDVNSSLCHQYYEGNRPLNTYDMSRLSGHIPMNRFLYKACCYKYDDELYKHGCPRWEAILYCNYETYEQFKEKAKQGTIRATSTTTTTTQNPATSTFDKIINALKDVDKIYEPVFEQFYFQLPIRNNFYM